MYLTDLALSDFRSYEQVLLSLRPGITTFVGENGQGKTNIVEAIGYLATLSSHRVSSDAALIRQGSTAAVVRARVMHGDHPTTVEVEIYAGHANRARVNRGQVRPPEILGNIRAVTFAPEDLELVRADPGARRRFLDDVMVQIRPRLAGVSAEYDKVARQRAAVLKAASAARRRGRSVNHEAIDVWDAQLAKLGSQITAARSQIVTGLRPHVVNYYRLVSGGRGEARIDYKANALRGLFELPSPLQIQDPELGKSKAAEVDQQEAKLADAGAVEKMLLEAMEQRRDQEIDRGVNLVGPHRDELVLSLGTLPAKGFASHGESWSYALALRLGAWQFLREDVSGEWSEDGEPILILDDVFAELDSQRRSRLAEIVADAGQVFVTAAVGDDLPEGLVGQRFLVHDGTVNEVHDEQQQS
ncbi:DNA replication/repair protein RecF [Changpingibacter yushuensis]|uniref:DNA replication/repair protein RecF n=1 Tax=Changpingibacter yushuensis TaxID=2758440 RepID=UPI00165D4D64|nr:DNA replication/repair protein RecF [Changpingibacter yushuensis]